MTTYTFTDLTDEDITILGEGLDELKFKRAGNLVEKLRRQIIEQTKPNVPVPVYGTQFVEGETDKAQAA